MSIVAGAMTLDCENGATIVLDNAQTNITLTTRSSSSNLSFKGHLLGNEVYQKDVGFPDIVVITPGLAAGTANEGQVSITENTTSTRLICKRRL
jgi:hypothetical protein